MTKKPVSSPFSAPNPLPDCDRIPVQDTPNAVKIVVEYADNHRLQGLFGPHHTHLYHLEHRLNLTIHAFGNQITLIGAATIVEQAHLILNILYQRLATEEAVSLVDIDQEIFKISLENQPLDSSALPTGVYFPLEKTLFAQIITPKKTIIPRTFSQEKYILALRDSPMVFALGPAGTGKSYLAMAMAVSSLMAGAVNRIILTRPAVEAGERLGFLPGDLKERVDPYLRPLYDALYAMMPAESVAKRLAHGEIEIAPLAFMRGRTLNNAFVVLDEAQNTTVPQMKMFLTRLGPKSIMSINGDLTQVDLPKDVESGLVHAVSCLKNISQIKMIHFLDSDIIRHPLIAKILDAYTKAKK